MSTIEGTTESRAAELHLGHPRRAAAEPAPSRGRRLQRPGERLARWLVLRMLARLHGGELVLIDEGRVLRFGEPLAERPLRAVLRVHSQRFYRQLLRGSVGLSEAYMQGLWDCDDLVSLTRIAALNVGASTRLRRRLAPVLVPVQRLARLAGAQHARARAQADRSSLRPRQRAVRAVPRPHDDVLLRRLR